jgi:hypothetical protein
MEGDGGNMAELIGVVVRMLEAYGLPGLAIIALGWLYLKQLQRNEAQQATIVSMAEKMGEGLTASTAAITRLTDGLIRGKRINTE